MLSDSTRLRREILVHDASVHRSPARRRDSRGGGEISRQSGVTVAGERRERQLLLRTENRGEDNRGWRMVAGPGTGPRGQAVRGLGLSGGPLSFVSQLVPLE